MYLLHIMLCCLIYGFLEGRILHPIIGRNFSFSWTFNYIWKDTIQITHNASLFIRVWPANNYVNVRAQVDRVKVVVETSAEKTVKVTVNYLNITKFDSGIYKVIREYNSEELTDSVVLATIGTKLKKKCINGLSKAYIITGQYIFTLHINTWPRAFTTYRDKKATFNNCYWVRKYTVLANPAVFPPLSTSLTTEVTPYTTMTTPQEDEENVYYAVTEVGHKGDNEGFKNYMTTALSGKKDSEENQHYTTAVTTAGINAEECPCKHHLLYIVFGMGAILAAAFFACLLHRIRICLCENRVANATTCAHSNMVDFD